MQGGFDDEAAGVVAHGLNELAELAGVCDGGKVGATAGGECAFEVWGDVSFHSAGGHAIAPDLACRLQLALGGFQGPTRFYPVQRCQ